MAWFRAKYGIGEDTIASLKIGYGDNDEPSIVRLFLDEPGAAATRLLAQDDRLRVTRGQDQGRIGSELGQAAPEIGSAHARHDDVAHDEIDRRLRAGSDL